MLVLQVSENPVDIDMIGRHWEHIIAVK